MKAECPGCGAIVVPPRGAAFAVTSDEGEFTDLDVVTEVGDFADFEPEPEDPIVFERLHDGRYIGIVRGFIFHECPYRGGGGTAGDRSPLLPEPPSDALPIELDIPRN